MEVTAVHNEILVIEKYPAYKDSGVEWLGEIPAHWEIQKGKWLFIKQERPVQKNDEIITCFRDGQVTLRINRKTEGFTNALKEHGYQGIREGDLVIHNMDAFAGAIGVSDSNGKSTPVYSVCTPRIKNKINSYYYAYFLRNLAKNGFIESLAKGIRERSTDFRFSDFGVLLLPFPPIEEQTRIAAFLDRKTAQIDQAIRIKENQIALLKEQKQTVIDHALQQQSYSQISENRFTPWNYPLLTHWIRKPLKYICSMKGRFGWQNLRSDEYTYEGPLLVSSEHFKNDKVNWEVCNHVTRERFEMAPEIILQLEDVLFMKDGASMGKLAFVDYLPGEACLNSHLLLMRPDRKYLIPKFLFYTLKSKAFYAYMCQERRGATFFGFSQQAMGNFPISFPSIEEQEAIVNKIDERLSRLFFTENKIQQSIEKLKEYKATLINSAVTGKIKVLTTD